MRKIDITTTQNVTIEYELATVMERSLAAMLDILFVYVGSFIVYAIIAATTRSQMFNLLYISLPASFLYHLLLETLNKGQSLGKKIFKIRVVKINGEQPNFFDFLMRTAFRFIDILMTSGTLAMIAISSSEKGQRLGDFLADTTVIRLRNSDRFTLSQLISVR
ncbi:MAG TPA: RDD family protein [Bacteroidales bacterium]|nr:RDD family protein [Bacteroidales bacterium]